MASASRASFSIRRFPGCWEQLWGLSCRGMRRREPSLCCRKRWREFPCSRWRGGFFLHASIFAAACYAANPYALLVVYLRSDFAEQLAWVFFPLLLLAALQLCAAVENRWRSAPRATAIFALMFACMWLSNAPAGVLASYSMALLFAWAAIARKSFTPLWGGAAGLALGFGLTAFYLLPAAYEQRWVNIGQALSSGLQPAQNFLYTKIADAEHNQFNWIASSIAILLMAMAGAAAIVAHQNTQREEYGEEKTPVRAVPMALDGYSCRALRVFCRRGRAPMATWLGLGRGHGNRGRLHGGVSGSQSLVGYG